MVLEAFACSVFSLTEFTKTQHFKLDENIKEKILDEGLYHFTSKDVADKIVKDGYFKPTKGRIKNHLGKDKVYMFAGLPDMINFSKNLPANLNPFVSGNLEFSAVRVNPNSQELSRFKERMQDSAIVYEGRYDIASGRAKAIDLVVDLDKTGKCIFREKTEKEKEEGYVPSAELSKYINEHKYGKTKNNINLMYQEIKLGFSSIPKSIPRFYNDFKAKSEKKRAIKEFEPYSFEIGVLDGEYENRYSVSADKLEFYGDKKLNKVRIDKMQSDGKTKSYECYVDGHVLNLGDEAAAIYLSRIEEAIDSKLLNKVNGLYYAGQPMLDVQSNDIVVGVDAKFNELLKERNMAEEIGNFRENSDNIFNKKVKDYYKSHPIKRIMNSIAVRRGQAKMLPDKNQIGKYTNEKLANFSLENVTQENIDKGSVFIPTQKCDFEYKEGSKYSAFIGETINLDGKILRKVMISEEENYLTRNAMDTAKLPQNYYIEDVDLNEIDKKDLAKYLSSLEYQNRENELKIEENGFVGRYVGGVSLNKKGKITSLTYDESLKERYGLEARAKKQDNRFDMSCLVCDELDTSKNYIENDKNSQKKIEDKEQEKIV